MARAHSVDDILKMKSNVHPFEGPWQEAFDQPTRGGVWFVCGPSTSGKSSFVMQWAKYMTNFGKVLYVSKEEGLEDSFRKRMKLLGMNDPKVRKRFNVVTEGRQEVIARLKRQRSAQAVIIDSIDEFDMSYQEYREFKKMFPRKDIMIVAQAKDGKPRMTLSQNIQSNAYQKVWVSSFMAICKGRCIGPLGHYIVWQEGYEKINLKQPIKKRK